MTILDRLRSVGNTLIGREQESQPATPKSPKSPADTWRFTDPNYNPNVRKSGRDFYDSPADPKNAPSVWDYHLQAEKAEREASHDVAKEAFKSMAGGDVLDASALRKLFKEERVSEIMDLADKNKDGKIDFKEFCDLIRKYPCE